MTSSEVKGEYQNKTSSFTHSSQNLQRDKRLVTMLLYDRSYRLSRSYSSSDTTTVMLSTLLKNFSGKEGLKNNSFKSLHLF